MRWALLLACAMPWCAHADPIYLCKAYSGGMFWSSDPRGPQKATLDRTVSVPDGLPWDQKVQLGEAAWAQARGLAAPPQPVQPPPQQQPAKQAECANLTATVANLDSQARQPQSSQMQDWIKDQRQRARDRQFRLQC